MKNKIILYFEIADHIIQIDDYVGIDIDKALPSFREFRVSDGTYIPIIVFEIRSQIDMTILPTRTVLSDISVIWLARFRFEETNSLYYTSILGEFDNKDWIMCSVKDFKRSIIYPIEEELYSSTKLSWLIMVAFGQACLAHQTLLIHASVVENGDSGIAFLGKSGTGKSTHARLWVENYRDFSLLNDDNPAIRIFSQSRIMIYGTPWSGKVHCYINKGVQLQSLIRLQQWPFNEITTPEGMFLLTTILPSCSAIRWNEILYGMMVTIVEVLVKHIKVGHLKCLPNKNAASYSYRFAYGTENQY